MQRSLKSLFAVALFSALSTAAAQASTMDLFTFSLSGIPGTGTATLDASPTPSTFVNNVSFTLNDATAVWNGDTYTGAVTFLASGGAIGDGFTFTGPTLFSGAVSSPTFTPGTYALMGDPDLGDGPVPEIVNLTISQVSTAVTPEPATLTLVGTAVLGFAGVLRRRLAA